MDTFGCHFGPLATCTPATKPVDLLSFCCHFWVSFCARPPTTPDCFYQKNLRTRVLQCSPTKGRLANRPASPSRLGVTVFVSTWLSTAASWCVESVCCSGRARGRRHNRASISWITTSSDFHSCLVPRRKPRQDTRAGIWKSTGEHSLHGTGMAR